MPSYDLSFIPDLLGNQAFRLEGAVSRAQVLLHFAEKNLVIIIYAHKVQLPTIRGLRLVWSNKESLRGYMAQHHPGYFFDFI
jgi:hypothetical protein